MEVVAAFRLDLVATDAARDLGISHCGPQPLLGRAAPDEGVPRRRRFDPIVPAVGITTAVEICIARDAGVYLRKREVFQALHLVRSFRPFLCQELARLQDWPVWPMTKSDGRQSATPREVRTSRHSDPDGGKIRRNLDGKTKACRLLGRQAGRTCVLRCGMAPQGPALCLLACLFQASASASSSHSQGRTNWPRTSEIADSSTSPVFSICATRPRFFESMTLTMRALTPASSRAAL